MDSIQQHSHEDRTQIINQLIPYLKNLFNDNFVAFAADGSYARNEDKEYSDLELIVFLKELAETPWEIRKIIKGLLVVVLAETKESFIQKYLEVNETWYASGAGKLLAIENETFIKEINDFKPDNLETKCLIQLEKHWPHYQEITSKVLNARKNGNLDLLALVFPEMVKEVLILLSFLNKTPYKTLASFISQAKNFELKPKSFDNLIVVVITGNYMSAEPIAKSIFSELEELLTSKGVKLYSNNIKN